MKHGAFYLPYWWQWLDQLALASNGYDTGDIRCEPTAEKWVDADRAVHISTEALFPGQHFIWTPVDLDKGGTGKLVPLYEYLGLEGARLNLEYIDTWSKWRARQVSSENLLPEKLRLLFADPNEVIVDEDELEAQGEEVSLAFRQSQAALFEQHMRWRPRD